MRFILLLLLPFASFAQYGEPRQKISEEIAHQYIGLGSYAKNYTTVRLLLPKKPSLKTEGKTFLIATGLSVLDGLAVEAYKMAKDRSRGFDGIALRNHIAGQLSGAVLIFAGRVLIEGLIIPLIKGDVRLTTLR